MKYFAIFDKNIATVFQLQWKIGNISDMFLQYSVLCGLSTTKLLIFFDDFFNDYTLSVALCLAGTKFFSLSFGYELYVFYRVDTTGQDSHTLVIYTAVAVYKHSLMDLMHFQSIKSRYDIACFFDDVHFSLSHAEAKSVFTTFLKFLSLSLTYAPIECYEYRITEAAATCSKYLSTSFRYHNFTELN